MQQKIAKVFETMGARAKVTVEAGLRSTPFRMDVVHDGQGEHFDIRYRQDIDVQVVDVQPRDRHLLLMAREPGWLPIDERQSKFLCGHDERAWFVAAIPESADVQNVQEAKDALKPQVVWEAMHEYGVPMDQRDRRRTAAFIRQGEWFFIPRPEAVIDFEQVLCSEPIRRGSGKPHVCQFMFRQGGEQVGGDWRLMTRGARVYVRGAVRHPDHATIWLELWHEVAMNTETQAPPMPYGGREFRLVFRD